MSFADGFRMAFSALFAHKLRSLLTLIGIIVGVASIIGVMTGLSVVQTTMEREMSVLGAQTFQVQKWPHGGFSQGVDWRAIQRRAPITVENAEVVRERVDSVDLVGCELWQFGAQASFQERSTEPVLSVVGGTPEYPENNTHYIEYGRNVSYQDIRTEQSVVVIGYSVAEQLFPFVDPIDRTIRIDGRDYKVIGVFEQKSSAMGAGFDNYLYLPISVFENQFGTFDRDGNRRSVNMTVRAKRPELLASAMEEVRGVLRIARGVAARDPDDFEMFSNDSSIRQFNDATLGVKVGAFVVGIIALIVAGIGIMNIMLVSVTERTREIGIRKALGARRRSILGQFLLEAILLCNAGGLLGVLVGFLLGNIVTLFTEFSVALPWGWAINGLVFCTLVGLGFGMWPALKASRLQPVEALSYE
jgi:putative ABC transport system permease protein